MNLTPKGLVTPKKAGGVPRRKTQAWEVLHEAVCVVVDQSLTW